MVGSKSPRFSSWYGPHAHPAAFRIVLAQDEDKKFDVHDTREFDLALDSKFPIGRASKNMSKGYLLPAKHNIYIDSPVVSREHATLSANASSGTPQVYITDTSSMHGTLVNGTLLVPNTPKQLSNGDKLQFGVSVNRGDSKSSLSLLPYTNWTSTKSFAGFFLAYEYTFKAELAASLSQRQSQKTRNSILPRQAVAVNWTRLFSTNPMPIQSNPRRMLRILWHTWRKTMRSIVLLMVANHMWRMGMPLTASLTARWRAMLQAPLVLLATPRYPQSTIMVLNTSRNPPSPNNSRQHPPIKTAPQPRFQHLLIHCRSSRRRQPSLSTVETLRITLSMKCQVNR
jgi:pSer/pThr/pTyr-binding forkhead associated (FHA) protein